MEGERTYENGRYPIVPRIIILEKKSIDRAISIISTMCLESSTIKIANNLHMARILRGEF